MKNPSAFPVRRELNYNGDVIQGEEKGMTLRDYFAGQYATGIMANPYSINLNEAAKDAYDFADAMLDERAKRK